MSATRILTGARWSSAARCAAKAEHEALNSPGAEDKPQWMDGAFARGFHIGVAWAMIQAEALRTEGKEAEVELEVPWGPPEFGWRGHVDLANMTDRIVYEAYHSKDLELRDEKILQAAGYATSLGPDWRAVVVAINATDVDADGGFATRMFPVDVSAFREEVLLRQAEVVTAVAMGEYNPADRVSDTPNHAECKSCPFSSICHAGYVPPIPEEVVGLEDKFVALRIADSDRHHAKAKLAATEAVRAGLIEQIAEFIPENHTVQCGDVTVKRITVKPSLTFSLTDALKAGHALPVELEAFAKPKRGYDRWEVIAP